MVRGFFAGVAFASGTWGLLVMVQRFDGSHTWRLGADGEEATAEVLARLGPDWQIFHNAPFATEFGSGEIDVDHIAIGPHGVLVIESKWWTDEIDIAGPRLGAHVERAVQQAKQNAGRVQAVLRGQVAPEHVIPVVVFWGIGVKNSGEPVARHDGVRVVRGGEADGWVGRISETRLDPDVRDRATAKILAAIERQERASGRRGRGADTSAWLLRWCRNVGAVCLSLGLGASVVLSLLVYVDAPARGWFVRLIGIVFGLAIPLALTAMAAIVLALGVRLRTRAIFRWWAWPVAGLAGWVLYATRLLTLV